MFYPDVVHHFVSAIDPTYVIAFFTGLCFMLLVFLVAEWNK